MVYYAGLLAWVGCHVDAYEHARWFGDDIAVKRDFRHVDGAGPGFLVGHLGAGLPPLERVRLGIAFLAHGREAAESTFVNHWRATDAMAARLGLGEEVRSRSGQIMARESALTRNVAAQEVLEVQSAEIRQRTATHHGRLRSGQPIRGRAPGPDC